MHLKLRACLIRWNDDYLEIKMSSIKNTVVM
jgi:hypothetical protein